MLTAGSQTAFKASS